MDPAASNRVTASQDSAVATRADPAPKPPQISAPRASKASLLRRRETCRFCAKPFKPGTYKATYKSHVVFCVGNPDRRTLRCEKCAVSFHHYSSLRAHMRSLKCSGFRPPEKKRAESFMRNYRAEDYPLLRNIDQKFNIFYVDPPWKHAFAKCSGSASAKYAVLDMATLKSMPVRRMREENSIMFMWKTGCLTKQAIELMEHWGFQYKTECYHWIKTKPKRPDEVDALCQGWYTNGAVETIIVGVRGAVCKHFKAKKQNQVVMSPRGAHSEKPEIFRKIILDMFEPGYVKNAIELFSRREADEHWSAWGDELGHLPNTLRYE